MANISELLKYNGSSLMNKSDIFQGMQKAEQNSAILLVYNILKIFVIAEYNVKISDKMFPWRHDEKLLKRRKAYTYDTDVQCLAKKLTMNNVKTGYLSSQNGYYKTELIINDKIYIHIHNTFDRNAIYLQPYFDMNNNEKEESYYYIQYTLNNKRKQILDIKIVNGNNELNLMEWYEETKNKMNLIIKDEYIKSVIDILDDSLSGGNMIEESKK